MHILLADDNPEVRSALRLLLEQEPISAIVIDVANTHDLLAQLSENCPMAVLLDWELPKLQKSDFLRMVRSSCPDMKIIALSSKFEARQEALAARVDAFISKSEPPEKILATLRSLVPPLVIE